LSSQLNVDTIVDKAGSGGTNVKIGNTSVTVAEGGSATMNTVQGLLKAWVFSHSDATLTDSFNLASGTDNSEGNYTFAFTNNMGDSNGSGAGSATDNSDRTVTIHTRSTSSYVVNIFNSGANYKDSRNRTMINGDLA